MAAMSRWLVGSSSSSTAGASASARASARRFFCPPESAATRASGSRAKREIACSAVASCDHAPRFSSSCCRFSSRCSSASCSGAARAGSASRWETSWYSGEQVRGRAHAGHHGFEHRQLRVEWRLLRHVGEVQAGLRPDLAIVEMGLAGQRREQEDLPLPLRPIRATRSPGSSWNSAWSRRATWPKARQASGGFQVEHGRY